MVCLYFVFFKGNVMEFFIVTHAMNALSRPMQLWSYASYHPQLHPYHSLLWVADLLFHAHSFALSQLPPNPISFPRITFPIMAHFACFLTWSLAKALNCFLSSLKTCAMLASTLSSGCGSTNNCFTANRTEMILEEGFQASDLSSPKQMLPSASLVIFGW